MNLIELLKTKTELIKASANKKEKPEFTAVYKDSVEYAERVSVHSKIGEFPEVLFKKRAPNQTPEEFEYIKANHKTITFPIWSRFIGVLNRIWSDQNWSIKWPDNSQEVQDYLQKKIPKYDNYEAFFKNIITPLKQQDANAVICVKPYDIPLKTDSTGLPIVDDSGNYIVDETQKIRPYPVIYTSEKVIAFEPSEYALLMTDEKSIVKSGSREQKVGIVMEYYDRLAIYKIIQIGDQKDYTFKIVLYWNHSLGYLPSWKLGGIPILKDNELLYQPHFMCAIESLDSALLDNSYLMAIKAGAAFPHKWEMVDECDFSNDFGNCVDGKIWKDGQAMTCPSCGGRGTKRPSVMGVYQIKMPTRLDDSTKDIVDGGFGWKSPPFEPMSFLRQEIELHKNEALSILNLQNSVTNAQGSDTALGKIIDREELFSFILSISNQLFYLLENFLRATIEMRESPGYPLPEISYPKNFSIRNENDITNEISQAKAAGAPDIAIRALLVEYMNIRFNSDTNSVAISDLAFIADKIITLSNQEIANKILSGTVAKWQDVLHTCLYSFISEAIMEDDSFMDKPMLERVGILEQKAKDMLLEITPQTNSTQSILEASAGSAA